MDPQDRLHVSFNTGDLDALQSLVGQTVRSISVNSDQSLLRFTIDDMCSYDPSRRIVFQASGECCSESWFADLIGYDALVGHTVAKIEAIPLPDTHRAPTQSNPIAIPEGIPTSLRLTDDQRSRQCYDVLYGYVITTDAGRCTLAFRNSSNGYYGGNLERVDEFEDPDDRWTVITDDWSA